MCYDGYMEAIKQHLSHDVMPALLFFAGWAGLIITLLFLNDRIALSQFGGPGDISFYRIAHQLFSYVVACYGIIFFLLFYTFVHNKYSSTEKIVAFLRAFVLCLFLMAACTTILTLVMYHTSIYFNPSILLMSLAAVSLIGVLYKIIADKSGKLPRDMSEKQFLIPLFLFCLLLIVSLTWNFVSSVILNLFGIDIDAMNLRHIY